jgi:hypothetical protein
MSILDPERVLGISMERGFKDLWCQADLAFDEFVRAARRIDNHTTWGLVRTRLEALDTELGSIGGYDEELDDAVDNETGSFFGPKEAVDKYLTMTDLMFEIEELLAGFILTLQGRLTAAKSHALKVYRASVSDGVHLKPTARALELINVDKLDVWHVANYIKHHDEWQAVLDRKARTTFDAIAMIGIAATNDGQWYVGKWPLCRAAALMTKQQSFAKAMDAMITTCRVRVNQMEEEILNDFSTVEGSLADARARNQPTIRASRDAMMPAP